MADEGRTLSDIKDLLLRDACSRIEALTRLVALLHARVAECESRLGVDVIGDEGAASRRAEYSENWREQCYEPLADVLARDFRRMVMEISSKHWELKKEKLQ